MAPRKRRAAGRRSPCPLSCALEVVGDRWSLLVVRDLLFTRKRTYNELLRSPEAVASNILAERIRRLLACGILRRTVYSRRPRRYAYALTPRGRGLLPVLQEIVLWSRDHLPGTGTPPPEALPRRARPKARTKA